MATPRSVEQMTNSRAGYKSKLTQFRNWLAKADSETTTSQFLDLKLQRLSSTFAGYDEVQSWLEASDPEQCNDRTEFETIYQKALVDAQKLMNDIKLLEPPSIRSPHEPQTFTPTSPIQVDGNVLGPPRLVLSQITLTKFSGIFEDWHAFYEIFVSLIHSNDAIPTVQKHHYLRAYLEGPAAKLLDSVPITAENYEVALGLLKSKYHQPKLTLRKHMQALFNLDSIKVENARALDQLLDSAIRHVRSLEARSQEVQT